MSHTHTSPVSRSPRMRRRVSSASALNRASISRRVFVAICVLTNIPGGGYRCNIRVGRYKEAVMSEVQQAVRDKYGAIAASVAKGSTPGGCCGPQPCGCGDPITSNLYSAEETGALPADAVAASLGCGNPTALIDLQPGQTVLDLGSGGGIDVLLSAKRVGPAGKVYGLDMTDEMLALARE